MLSEFWEGAGFGVFAALTFITFRGWRLERWPGAPGATAFYAFVSALLFADGTLFDHRGGAALLAHALGASLLTEVWQTRRGGREKHGRSAAQR